MNRPSVVTSAALPVFAILLLGRVVSTQEPRNPGAAALKNPVAATPESIAAGKKAYDANCGSCHGNMAQGAVKAGVVISIIQEQGGKQPPDLTDDDWDHGSTDGEIYTVIKKGVPPTMMAGWDGRISGHRDLEHRQLPARARGEQERRCRGAGRRAAGDATADTGAGRLRPDADHRRHRRREHARPAGARQFPARRAGRPPLLRERPQRAALHPRQADRSSSRRISISTASAGGRACSARFTFERNFATGLINVIFDPDYARNGVFYTIHMEDPTIEAPAEPKSGVVPGLDSVGLPDDAGDRDADSARRDGSTAKP